MMYLYNNHIIYLEAYLQDFPLYSVRHPSIVHALAPLAAVSESPRAATMSISPALSLCTDHDQN